MYSMLVFLLIVYQFQNIFASQPGTEKHNPDHTRYPGHGSQSWPQDKNTIRKWNDWYNKWVDEQDKLRKKDKELIKGGWTDYDHTIKPRRWTRFPPGRDHQEPPPWAIFPNNYGKPDFCFQPPLKGDCTDSVKRWGFNPYADQCQKFEYSGCGGNSNNFLNPWRCKEACLKLGSSLCLKYGNRRDGVALEGRPGC